MPSQLSVRKKSYWKATLIGFSLAVASGSTHIARAQTFNCGSTGANGALEVTTPGTYDFYPGNTTQFPLLTDPEGDNIFHFTTINIASGVTLRMSGRFLNGPVFLRASGDVKIDGTIDLNGEDGAPNTNIPANRTVAFPGAGGYAGGIGGNGTSPAQPGNGPSGGESGVRPFGNGNAGGGGFSGNAFLVPLIGGSGGGGGHFRNVQDPFGAGGGAGGGALLICSSTALTINGSITAKGGSRGQGASPGVDLAFGGPGAGGAIRLVSPILKGTGNLVASVIRFEVFQQSFAGNTQPASILASPFALFIPATSAPSVRVTSIDGQPGTVNPTGSFTVPDVGINKSTPVTVNILAKNIPLGTVVKLYISSENAPDQTADSTPLTGSLSSSTATASVTLPSGFSRGFVRATWTAP